MVAACAGVVVSATIWSGPLNPGPNPEASRSYEVRVVVPSGSLPWSDRPRRRLKNGAASRPMIARATAPHSTGRRSTIFDHRSQNPSLVAERCPSAASFRR